jgi:hypothetical protein
MVITVLSLAYGDKYLLVQNCNMQNYCKRFVDEPGSQIVANARSTASANQKPPNGTAPGLAARTDNKSGTSALRSLAAAPRGYGGFRTMQ